MLQVKTSPRSKNFHHSFITTTCPNLSEYFLETNQTNNSKKQKKEDIHSSKKGFHIPVLKNFHQVIYRNNGEEWKHVNSIRSFSQEKTEPGESFEKREIITDFRRSPKQNFDDINCLSTKATPRLDQDNEQAQLKDSKSLFELLSILESKELEIRKLRQTNANLEKNVNQFSLIKEEYDKTDLKKSLEKYDKIIGVYSELLRKLSKHIPHEIKHSNHGLENAESFHKTFPASSQNREKRSSIDAHIKSVSDIYFNETPTGESLGTTKISTGQNMSLYCKLYEKVHSK